MTNNQLFFALAALYVSVNVTQIALLRMWINAKFGAVDAKFAAVDARFATVNAQFATVDRRFDALDARLTSIDNQLKFLVEHMVNHGERIARLEAGKKS